VRIDLPLAAGDPELARFATLHRLPEGAARQAAVKELAITFVSELVAAMRRTVPTSDFLPPSPARAVYEGTFDRAFARALTARDALGLEALFTLKNPAPSADSVSGSPGDRGDESQWQKRPAGTAS
jgi:hypothetical protein